MKTHRDLLLTAARSLSGRTRRDQLGLAALARRIEVPPHTVYSWFQRNTIPEPHWSRFTARRLLSRDELTTARHGLRV